MQSLALPRPSSILPTPFGRPVEPDDSLAKLRAKVSPTRSEQHSYPSPPMSEPHSPVRRPAQTSEAAHLSYPPPESALQRTDAGSPLLPPSSSLYDARSAAGVYNSSQQRPLYPEPQHRGMLLQYQHGRSGEHHSYSNVPVSQNYGYGYTAVGMPSYLGSQHMGPMVQQAAMIAPPPARPNKPARRTKAHVASACVNCKKAHLSCDVQRPCGRCVASGKQESCKDVQHKKRGRPRLRDEREFTRPEEGRPPGQVLGALPASEAFVHQPQFAPLSSRRSSEPSRSLGDVALGSNLPHSQVTPLLNGIRTSVVGGHLIGTTSSHPAGPNLAYQSIPVAFLNLDLIIQKSNQAFSDLVAFLGDIKGKHLGDLLEARQNESLQRLRNELRDERDEREPTYMAPITPLGHDPMRAVMEAVADQDVDLVSQGYTDRPMFLSFRLPSGGQYQSLKVQIRLAKTSLYFATLVVRSPSQFIAPSLSTKQLAPPTPMGMPTNTALAQYTPHPTRPISVTSSAPSSPYFNFSSVRTSLPTFSPGSYSSSSPYGYSPTAGPDPGYFPTIQPPSKPTPGTYQGSYATLSRNPSASLTTTPLRELNRPAHLEGLHLPPIRTGPAPLGSPLHIETSHSGLRRESDRLRRCESSSSIEQRRPETPESSKRRRLDIHGLLE